MILIFSYIYFYIYLAYSWGTLCFECIFSLNALTGGTIDNMLKSRENRVILASMIRECQIVIEIHLFILYYKYHKRVIFKKILF